ncbi:MAG TPA: DUF1326 domain-containing protein [Stellaceae bacterium]|nr:DUF1326 domain-containing protein [Stellaceae bacterium]
MAESTWSLEGRYFETCNCKYLCPCISSNLTAKPDEGDCKVALAFQIERGSKDGTTLDGLSFIVVARTPGVMADGNWTVGLVIDDQATEAQGDAILAIASGQAGGPMAHLGPLIGTFAGVERRPIKFAYDSLRYSVVAGELIAQACEGVTGAADPSKPMALDNTGHPVNTRLALAHATRSRFNAFGIVWSDESGTRNGHFAPFRWSA